MSTPKKSFLEQLLVIIAVAMCCYQILNSQYNIFAPIENQNIHLLFALLIIFLGDMIRAKTARGKLLNLALIACSLFGTAYIHINYNALALRAGVLTLQDTVVGVLLIVLAIESCRRTFGLIIPAMTVTAIIYMLYGNYTSGIFYHGGFSFPRTVASLTTTFNGLYGSLLGVSASFIAIFMIFGGLLNATGGGSLFMDLAKSIGGKFKAGPALTAVISSGLMGSINGSATANVATTGVVTIPLMKKSGFTPAFAGAVEAAASTGGMILPPIMGVGAFVMAELTGIPYYEIALAALIPALLYYLLVFMVVIFYANKSAVAHVTFEDTKSVPAILKEKGYNLIPVVAICYGLFKGYSPTTAGLYGIYSLICIALAVAIAGKPGNILAVSRWGEIVSNLLRNPRSVLAWPCWKQFVEGFIDGAKNAAMVAAILAAVGIMVQAAVATGLAHRFVFELLLMAETIFVALLLTMGLALFFGMGVPSTASYILLSSLVAPVLVKLGVPLLAAHLFIYYYTIIANLTPPVGSAAIVASRIADANFTKTCFISMRLAMVALILPFMFVYKPALLAQGSFIDIFETAAFAAIGLVAFAAGWEGWLLTSTSWFERALLLLAGVLLIPPLPLWISAVAMAILAVPALLQWRKSRAPTHCGSPANV